MTNQFRITEMTNPTFNSVIPSGVARHDRMTMPRNRGSGAGMRMSILTGLLIAAAAAVFAAEEKKEGTPMNSSNEVAVIKTNEGEMVVQFWTDAEPNTIENFKKLARQGFYDGTIFHRI